MPKNLLLKKMLWGLNMKNIKPMTEKKMVDKFLFEKDGQNYIRYVKEVPIFAKSIDLVKVDQQNNYISAIEFKTTKWRYAIKQVLESAIAFDFLEICVLLPRTEECQKLIINECERKGIGLFFIDAAKQIIEHIVEPIQCNNVWEIQRLQILQYLEGEI